MKKIIALTILFAAFTSTVFSSNYEEVMKTNIDKMLSLTSSTELIALANQFERIANTEKTEWLPGYYSAYCFVRSTFFDEMKNDEKHQQLDKAQKIIDQLVKSNKKESEVFALQALVYQLRITDMSKGYKYSKLATEAIGVAKKLNPENPRVYYLRGSNTFHTPKMFGGGAEKAKPDLEKASKMFETYKAENELLPSWGSLHNNQLLSKCK
ncbi:MAG: hypothetical protein L3J11_04380 [Draconibacterium sp.]|nr:hypothetical protein [Draconibacterium sp.]